MMLAGLSTWHAEHTQVVIVGPQDREDTVALLREIGRHYRPLAVVVPVTPGSPQDALANLLPFVGPMRLRESHATAYICRAFTCREPVTDVEALAAQL